MDTSTSVQNYIAMQPRLAWRRRLMHGLLRTVGFTLLCKVEASGQENIPDNGPTILMMNHISGLDPFVCAGSVTNRYAIPMAKAEVMKNPVIAFLFRMWGAFLVKRGEVDRKALMNSIELAKSGQLILIAPEGTRSPEGLIQPKKGVAYVATKANAVVVPSAISYAQGWRKRWKRLRRAYARVHFGTPFKFKTDGRKRIPREELSAMTEEAMYQLAMAVVDENCRGVYSDLSKATTEFIEFVNS